MKGMTISRALCELDPEIVEEYIASAEKKAARKSVRPWMKWSVAAACLLLAVFGAGKLMPQLIGRAPATDPSGAEAQTRLPEELVLEKAYRTTIPDGTYAGYRSMRVCEPAFVGEKLDSTTVEAGWVNASGEYISGRESLRAEVYAIKGIDEKAAVCLKFIDKGEALTMNHYYVYTAPALSAEGLAEIRSILWPQPADPGPAEGGTVTVTRASTE